MRSLKKHEWVAVVVALAGVAILFFGNSIWGLVTGKSNTSLDQTATKEQQTTMVNISNTTGLEIYEKKIGDGAEAVTGKTVSAHYVGTLADGTKFDSSLDRGSAFEFKLGAGQVIKGWDLGLVGMRVGGVRKLIISPEYGYGQQSIGPIPANSTLTFEVQLVGVK